MQRGGYFYLVLSATLALSLAGAAGATPAAAQTNLYWGGYTLNLPTIFLEAPQELSKEQKVAGKLQLVNPKGRARENTAPQAVNVRYHGATSLGYPKRSYAISFDKPTALLQMPAGQHWVLNASFIDRSLMRHKLSYDLFLSLSRAGAPRHAARSSWVEVYFNGKYQGVYLLMQRVDGEMLGLRPFEKNAPNPACLYKAVDHAANFGQPGHAGYEQREPDPVQRAFWEPLDELNRFASRAPDKQFFDAQTGIASRLDLENAMDFHLLVLLTSNSDGITKNFLIGRDAVSGEGPPPKFFFVPWDYDGTFGQNWNATPYPHDAWLSNHLFDRLMSNQEYRRRLAERWRQWREREFSVETICSRIDAGVRALGWAADRNAIRWKSAAGIYPNRLSFEEDIARMKKWIEARVKWLDAAIKKRAGN